MTFSACLLDLADRKPDQGLFEFCTPLRIAKEHGYVHHRKEGDHEKGRYYVDFEDEETFVMFKLRYL